MLHLDHRLHLIACLSLLVWAGCDSGGSQLLPAELLANGDAERSIFGGSAWTREVIYRDRAVPYGPFPGSEGIHFSWSDDASFSGNRSLAITTQLADSIALTRNHGGRWIQHVQVPDHLRGHGKTLYFRGHVKLDNFVGHGLDLFASAFRSDHSRAGPNTILAIASTFIQNQPTLTGTHDWTPFEFTVPINEEFRSAEIGVGVMGPSSGTVYFDDLSLILE